MFWTTLALLLLVVTGGFISYFGDLQGRRWGKKRVSWFSLRPKHTAILITSLTGGLITLLTVAAVIAAVPNVREVILKGEAAINDLDLQKKQYKKDMDAAQLQLKENSAQIAIQEATIEDQKRGSAAAKAENATLKGTNGDLEKRNSSLAQLNMDLQRKQALVARSIQADQKELVLLKRERANYTLINTDLGRQTDALERDKLQLEGERARLQTDIARLRNANLKLKGDNDNLVATNLDLERGVSGLKNTYQEFLEKNAKEKEQLNQTQAQNANLRGANRALEQQLEDLSNQVAGSERNFLHAYTTLLQTRYNLRADTELARRTLDAHLSPRAAKEELLALLKDASDRARQYGAVIGDNGRTVVIVPKRVVTPASIQLANENASLNGLVDSVAGSNTPVVVIARTINNSTANEQVLVELTPYSSAQVFQPGAIVASRQIDAKQSIDQIVNSVIVFLKEDVRDAAIKAGTIPLISPETGEQEVGTIDTPDMVALVDRIRKFGGKVTLTAVANEAISSADLLTFGQTRGGKPHNLRFDLKRASGKPERRGESSSAAQAR